MESLWSAYFNYCKTIEKLICVSDFSVYLLIEIDCTKNCGPHNVGQSFFICIYTAVCLKYSCKSCKYYRHFTIPSVYVYILLMPFPCCCSVHRLHNVVLHTGISWRRWLSRLQWGGRRGWRGRGSVPHVQLCPWHLWKEKGAAECLPTNLPAIVLKTEMERV